MPLPCLHCEAEDNEGRDTAQQMRLKYQSPRDIAKIYRVAEVVVLCP